MKEKRNYDNLYVACGVFEDEYEEEMWEQYETVGSVRHTIFINPKRVLIYSKTDEEGNVRYYNYQTSEEVDEKCFTSSFYTASSPMRSLYCHFVYGMWLIPFDDMREGFKRKFVQRTKDVGYFIPFDEYMECKLGISLKHPPLLLASKLVDLTNIGAGKEFPLSQDEKEASEQLAGIGYHKEIGKSMSKTAKK